MTSSLLTTDMFCIISTTNENSAALRATQTVIHKIVYFHGYIDREERSSTTKSDTK